MSKVYAISIPINGKSTKLKLASINIDSLVPDEENPRIGLFRDNQLKKTLTVDEIKFAIANKSPEAYNKLKESIHNNKGIINPIWVQPLQKKKYLVIEGNSRLMIYKDLVNIEPNESQWKSIIAYILPEDIDEDEKNFIRLQAHLRGTNEWDAYEKAKYLYKLSNEDIWPVKKIEKQTKLSIPEINQNIAAFKLMQQQYLSVNPDPNEITKFSYFVEYVKDNKLKKVMEKHGLDDLDFCEWVGDKTKIPTGQNVRNLRDIIEDEDAREIFLSKGFEPSMQIIAFRNPNVVDPFYRDMERTIERLKNMRTYEISEISTEKGGGKKRLLSDLSKWSAKILEMIDGK
jgi:hypothetical protein